MLNYTILDITGKQPHSSPPARRGQNLSHESLKALFHKSIEKFP